MLSQGKQGRLKSYNVVADFEKRRSKEGYIRLEEYEYFYLYGRVDKDNNILYKETFSKFDIDGVKNELAKRQYNGKMHKGLI